MFTFPAYVPNPECEYFNGIKYEIAVDKIINAPSEEIRIAIFRTMIRRDLFFLGYFVCRLYFLNHPFLVARCNEVQEHPDGYIDLWGREHGKSTVITFLKSIQDVLIDPDVTIGILSYRADIAEAFLNRIMREFESNEVLIKCFPDILYTNPRSESPQWSLEKGIIVRRKTNPAEATIEAHGMISGMPTSKHYQILIYEDIITKDAVKSPQTIEDVTNSWEISLNLSAERPNKPSRKRYVGTRYHFADTYRTIMDRKAAIPRIYPGTDNGQFDGKPVYWSKEIMEQKIREMGRGTFAAQILQNPLPEGEEDFSISWINYWPAHNFYGLNVYIICDPAAEKKKTSDWTVFITFGLGMDSHIYIIDIIRDKLSLVERANVLFKLHKDYKPIKVGYEKYGKDSDIEYFKIKMKQDNYRFHITVLGGRESKNDRIKSLEPDFRNGIIYLPEHCIHRNYEGKQVDTVKAFVEEEYSTWPYGEHDDIFDAMARIRDEEMHIAFPNATTGTGTAGVPMDYLMSKMKQEQYNPLTFGMGIAGGSQNAIFIH